MKTTFPALSEKNGAKKIHLGKLNATVSIILWPKLFFNYDVSKFIEIYLIALSNNAQ